MMEIDEAIKVARQLVSDGLWKRNDLDSQQVAAIDVLIDVAEGVDEDSFFEEDDE